MRVSKKTLAVGVAATVLSVLVAVPALAVTTANSQSPGWAGAVCRGTSAASQAVADLLGLTPEEIVTERESGKSLAEMAEANGQTKEDLVDAMLAAKKAQLDQAVTDGRLTQERADLMLERMTERISERVDDATMGSRGGGGMGNGMRGGGAGCGACGGSNAPAAPSTSL